MPRRNKRRAKPQAKRPLPKRRNPGAKALGSPHLRQRIVPNKKRRAGVDLTALAYLYLDF